MFYDEYLKNLLPKLRNIANPSDRLELCETEWKKFRKTFPDVVGAKKYFALIEIAALDELHNTKTGV